MSIEARRALQRSSRRYFTRRDRAIHGRGYDPLPAACRGERAVTRAIVKSFSLPSAPDPRRFTSRRAFDVSRATSLCREAVRRVARSRHGSGNFDEREREAEKRVTTAFNVKARARALESARERKSGRERENARPFTGAIIRPVAIPRGTNYADARFRSSRGPRGRGGRGRGDGCVFAESLGPDEGDCGAGPQSARSIDPRFLRGDPLVPAIVVSVEMRASFVSRSDINPSRIDRESQARKRSATRSHRSRHRSPSSSSSRGLRGASQLAGNAGSRLSAFVEWLRLSGIRSARRRSRWGGGGESRK